MKVNPKDGGGEITMYRKRLSGSFLTVRGQSFKKPATDDFFLTETVYQEIIRKDPRETPVARITG